LLHFFFKIISVQLLPFFFIPLVGSSSQMVHEGEGGKDASVGALVGSDVASGSERQAA